MQLQGWTYYAAVEYFLSGVKYFLDPILGRAAEDWEEKNELYEFGLPNAPKGLLNLLTLTLRVIKWMKPTFLHWFLGQIVAAVAKPLGSLAALFALANRDDLERLFAAGSFFYAAWPWAVQRNPAEDVEP